MMMIHGIFIRAVLVLIIFNSETAAHPIYQQQFNRIVNQNPCLKDCFDQSAKSGDELDILKTSNITNYLLDSAKMCSIITTAKKCIDACNYNSNPFDLEAMNAICRPISSAEIRLLTPCLQMHGFQLAKECISSCGDVEVIKRAILEMSNEYQVERNDAYVENKATEKIGELCNVIKCSNRCTMKRLYEQCSVTENGREPAAIFRSLIERVLVAQRDDLDRMQLTDTMSRTVPPQCSYMYMPDAMFDFSKKDPPVEMLRPRQHNKRAEGGDTSMESSPEDISTPDRLVKNSSPLFHMQVKLMHKQMELMTLEESNLKRQAKNLDVELKMALQKESSMKTMNYKSDTDMNV